MYFRRCRFYFAVYSASVLFFVEAFEPLLDWQLGRMLLLQVVFSTDSFVLLALVLIDEPQ